MDMDILVFKSSVNFVWYINQNDNTYGGPVFYQA